MEFSNQVASGNPVVAWVTLNYQSPQWHQYNWGRGTDNAHVVTVDGYSNQSVHVVDPENGTYWISKSAFNTAYSYIEVWWWRFDEPDGVKLILWILVTFSWR